MTAESLFSLFNMLAMAGWILLVAGLWWSRGRIIVQRGIIPILLSLIYFTLVVLYFRSGEGGFGSLAEVSALFENPYILLAGWVHYLAFDLWVGSWELEDSRKKGINRWLMLPCFFLTFMFGPIGLIFYLFIRTFKTGKLLANENF